MSMLDIHAQALADIDEGFHGFLLRYKSSDKVLYGFVEGKDDSSYYKSIIERFVPDEWKVELLLTGGKKKSLKTASSFDWTRFDKRRICFFVDRDVDDFVRSYQPSDENIYYTDGYSIENSFVNSGVFERILSEAYSIVDADPQEEQSLVQDFDRGLADFEELLVPLMAQIIVWRLGGIRANLNNCSMNSLFDVNGADVRRKAGCESVDTMLAKFGSEAGATPTDTVERTRIESIFRAEHEKNSLTRGKFLIWFLHRFSEQIHANIMTRVAAYNRPPRARVTLNVSNISLFAAPRARIPKSLREFIDRTYLTFVGDSRSLIS